MGLQTFFLLVFSKGEKKSFCRSSKTQASHWNQHQKLSSDSLSMGLVFCLLFSVLLCPLSDQFVFCLSHRWGWDRCCVIPFFKFHYSNLAPFKTPAPSRLPDRRLSPRLCWLPVLPLVCPVCPELSSVERDNDEMMKCCAVIPPQCTRLSGVLWTSPLASRYWPSHLTPEGESGVKGQKGTL